jgi:hypothetical protein
MPGFIGDFEDFGVGIGSVNGEGVSSGGCERECHECQKEKAEGPNSLQAGHQTERRTLRGGKILESPDVVSYGVGGEDEDPPSLRSFGAARRRRGRTVRARECEMRRVGARGLQQG